MHDFKRYPSDPFIDELVLWFLAGFILMGLFTGCKSLEQKCAERFPPSINREFRIEIRDTTLPEHRLAGKAGPCPEWFNNLPSDGAPVVIAEDNKSQIRAKRGKNGSIALEAIINPQNIGRTNTTETTREEQVIQPPCDCKAAIVSAKWNLTYKLTGIFGICLLIAVGSTIYLVHNYHAKRRH
jgi:hypothetical protein